MNLISWPAPSAPSTQQSDNRTLLIRQAFSSSLSGKLELNAKRLSPGSDFIDKVTSVFEKISANLNKQLDDINKIQRERQAAMRDLFAVRDALAKCRSKTQDPNEALDLTKVEIHVSPDSPLAEGGVTKLPLTAVMNYYRDIHDELGLPGNPETGGELESYLEGIDMSLKMVLEPASQDAHAEMERLTQQSRAMEQLQAMLYQIYYDALKKFTNAS